MKLLRWLGIVVVLLLLVALALSFVIQANTFRPMLESTLTNSLAREVKLGDLKLAIFSGSIAATDLTIADDPAFGKTPFVRAKELKIGVELAPLLFSRKLNVTGLTIEQPEIALVESSSGVWNFSNLGAKSSAPPTNQQATATSKASLDLSVKLVKISNGRLTIARTSGRSKPLVLEKVNIDLKDFSSSSAFPFSLATEVAGGGTLKLSGKLGPLDQANVATTPFDASLNIGQLDVARSGLNSMAPDIAGLVSFDGSGASDGKTFRADGKLKVEKLKAAKKGTPARRPVEFTLAVEHDLKQHSGRLTRGDIHLGKAPASLTGTYAERNDALMHDALMLNMNLAGTNMPVGELAEMLPALGIVLPAGSSLQSGTANAKLSMEGPADRLVVAGTLALNGARLTGFDLGKKMSIIETLAGMKSTPDTEIQTLSANVRYAPQGANVQDIQLIVTGVGDLSGNGTVSPDNALDFKMRATVRAAGLAAMVSNTPIPFSIQGTSSNPTFRPDMKSMAVEQLKNIPAGKAATDILRGFLGGKKK